MDTTDTGVVGKHRDRYCPQAEIRHSHHIIRNVHEGEIDTEEIQLGIHHHRRSTPNQECRLAPLADHQDIRQSRTAPYYWYTITKQPTRTLGIVELYPSRCLFLQVS